MQIATYISVAILAFGFIRAAWNWPADDSNEDHWASDNPDA
jgi:hypothetical protein